MSFWNGVLWLHLLAMAFFIGGQLMLAAVVVPVLRGREEFREPLRAAARRFGIGTLIAVGVLVITGAAMASHNHVWGDSTLHVKLGLVVLVGILIGAHMRSRRRRGDGPSGEAGSRAASPVARARRGDLPGVGGDRVAGDRGGGLSARAGATALVG